MEEDSLSITTKIKNRTQWLLSFPISWGARIFAGCPTVIGEEDSLKRIISNSASVARYGDGEFNLIWGNSIDFQTVSQALRKNLSDILKLEDEKFMVCIPHEFYDTNGLIKDAADYWKKYERTNCLPIRRSLKKGKTYYSASISRFYRKRKNKAECGKFVELWKQVWDKRDIVFVEGDKSRLGVGNDLFDNAKSVRRILCPSINAFDYYDSIVAAIENKVEKEALLLLALGPTATVLAYDLYKKEYQAIDVGHIDIEYEWMRMGATAKVAVRNKYTNEAEDGKDIGVLNNAEYLNQIIEKVGC